MIFHPLLSKLLLAVEVLSALVALYYFFRLKESYWKLFSIYLIIIALQELFWYFQDYFAFNIKQNYFAYFGIPIQFLFLFWLYAKKSLKRKKLFYLISLIYLLTYIPIELFYESKGVINSINLTIGIILLVYLITLEYLKQIKNDDILLFKENKMFYINIGVILAHVGTYPFYAFYNILIQKAHHDIWNIYYLYFLLANIFMYILFIASFIWGKHR